MTKSNKRKLYRSKKDKVLAGIFGGLGEYFDIDSNLLRLIFLFILFLTFFSGLFPFLIIYLIAMFIIPTDRGEGKSESENEDRGPIYKKWWFWLIVFILLLPVILVILGFVLFMQRTSIATDSIDFIEERVIIDYPENEFDHIEILYPKE